MEKLLIDCKYFDFQHLLCSIKVFLDSPDVCQELMIDNAEADDADMLPPCSVL